MRSGLAAHRANARRDASRIVISGTRQSRICKHCGVETPEPRAKWNERKQDFEALCPTCYEEASR